jgi:hypothetical protein
MPVKFSVACLAAILTMTVTASAQVAPCRLPGVGFIANNTLEQCARLAQAYQGGGIWGQHRIQMAFGNLAVDGAPVGRVRNPSGTFGSLTQRCTQGDIGACNQYSRQADNAMRQYDSRMKSRNLGQ